MRRSVVFCHQSPDDEPMIGRFANREPRTEDRSHSDFYIKLYLISKENLKEVARERNNENAIVCEFLKISHCLFLLFHILISLKGEKLPGVKTP